MKISGIYSLRDIKKEVFRDVVYEWEDDISVLENIPVVNIKNNIGMQGFGLKIRQRIDRNVKFHRLDTSKPVYVAFITVLSDLLYFNSKNCIPIFLDIALSNIGYILKKFTSDSPFCITIYDFYKALELSNSDINYYYMPLMISDRWKDTFLNSRPFDLIQVGRKNEILHKYALEFVNKFPQYNYVYSDNLGTLGELYYFSTSNGEIGSADTREQYMDLLKKSKICVLSSPGIDNPKPWLKGMDFPTPRFYEAAISGCSLLGRISTHEEFSIQKVSEVVVNVSSYEEFEQNALEMLEDRSDKKSVIESFADSHLTSKWWNEFMKKLDNV